MALFESSWDTKSSNEALIRNSAPSVRPKGGKDNKDRRDSTTKSSASFEGNTEGANIDLDKLLRKMTDIGGGVKGKGNDKGKGKGKGDEKGGGRKVKSKNKDSKDKETPILSKTETIGKSAGAKKGKDKETREGPVEEAVTGEKRKAKESGSPVKSKKQKKKNKEQAQAEPEALDTHAEDPVLSGAQETVNEPLSELQKLVKQNLQGSKFRIINEKLYKSSSRDAQDMMQKEPETYTEASRTIVKHQTKSWPSNPVDLISASLSTLPPRSIVVDLGCGDAQLAKTLVPQGLNVLSFDLVSDNKWVVEADICTRIPLPGSEDPQYECAIADACVCSLSLMSTNWIGCGREAWRVLRTGGRFVVAEVTSRFRDSKEFVKVLSELGFELVEKSAPSTHFLLFEFRKVERKRDIQTSWKTIQTRTEGLLKPCEYKRR
ncbi:unnamed protein product [Rhizoctonia solani]|uniref:Ribosomal RNA-processing protein 8 n=1 Tax=Rhizoctonia solani TaxID=456999 RepID=A0A8H3ASN0_9AGAM|nr:unnamed protein product [Rhizoctonia solani]